MATEFNFKHAAGVTRFKVIRAVPHGFYECLSIQEISGTHHGINGFQWFTKDQILKSLKADL